MKERKLWCMVLFVVMLFGCTSSPKAEKPKTATKGLHAEYTDWQGAAFGAEIPKWVSAVVTAENEEIIRKLLDKPAGYRVWAVQAQGEDLDALKMLTDNFDIQAQVGASISQNIAQIAERIQEEGGETSKAKIATQTAKVVNLINMNLTLNGLERVTSYWSKYYMADKNGKPIDGETGKERYSYVVVMGMDGDRLEQQLDVAMRKIKDNTAEDEYLRKISDLVIADLKAPELLTGVINVEMTISN